MCIIYIQQRIGARRTDGMDTSETNYASAPPKAGPVPPPLDAVPPPPEAGPVPPLPDTVRPPPTATAPPLEAAFGRGRRQSAPPQVGWYQGGPSRRHWQRPEPYKKGLLPTPKAGRAYGRDGDGGGQGRGGGGGRVTVTIVFKHIQASQVDIKNVYTSENTN